MISGYALKLNCNVVNWIFFFHFSSTWLIVFSADQLIIHKRKLEAAVQQGSDIYVECIHGELTSQK